MNDNQRMNWRANKKYSTKNVKKNALNSCGRVRGANSQTRGYNDYDCYDDAGYTSQREVPKFTAFKTTGMYNGRCK